MQPPDLSDLPLARATSLVQQVHAELKARILDGRIPPGARVPDSVIAKQMGVSRAPVRDACNLLVQSGLLTKQPHHPYQVRAFSEHDLSDFQLIRWGYESAAVRILVRSGATPEDVSELLDDMTRAAQSGDVAMSGQADLAFHLALVRATEVDELIRRHASLMEQMAAQLRGLPAAFIATQRHRHQELLDVLGESQRQQDPGAILRLLSTHLLTTRADVKDMDMPNGVGQLG